MENKKIKVGIVGGAGFTAGELIRILIHHPLVKISSIVSTSNAGNLVSKVHEDLLGDTDLIFNEKLNGEEEVIFLCLGHGNSRKFLEQNQLKANVKVIDLSNDLRLKKQSTFLTRDFIYGLIELNKDSIKASNNIANPGCFATSIQLALLPLAKNNLLKEAIHISAITGSTGAGRELVNTTGFNYRNNNISSYKEFTHQHLDEIKESIHQLQPSFAAPVYLIPYRGNFTRGILSSVYTPINLSVEEITEIYTNFYKSHPFTVIAKNPINLKQVINTNKCILHVQKHEDQLLITSVIDNLVKGASGQAIQNMNLMFGLNENEGLNLKSTAF